MSEEITIRTIYNVLDVIVLAIMIIIMILAFDIRRRMKKVDNEITDIIKEFRKDIEESEKSD